MERLSGYPWIWDEKLSGICSFKPNKYFDINMDIWGLKTLWKDILQTCKRILFSLFIYLLGSCDFS